VLADGGGGNGSRARAWKFKVQELLCDRFGLEVTVCHYPPGCSKWNPVEHRLFSQVSRNWAGKPLRSRQPSGRTRRCPSRCARPSSVPSCADRSRDGMMG
jgi:Rhodopirellula transposase DDE domain